MATFREMIYMVLDMLKEHSDDAYYTEDHVLFLLKNMRNFLIEKKYKGSRNSTFSPMSEENKQQICLTVKHTMLLPFGCSGIWLKSDKTIPEISGAYGDLVCTGHDLLPTVVTLIPQERMRFVGFNKWLANIIYASRSIDGHLYLRSNNPMFENLEMVGVTGIFSDIEKAAELSHEACVNGSCDILDQKFPLESDLIQQCIELVFQELSGARYAPEDKTNDAKDNLGDVQLTKNASTPATRAGKTAEE